MAQWPADRFGQTAVLRSDVRPGPGSFTFADPADRAYLLNPQDAHLIKTIAANSGSFGFGSLPPGDQESLPTRPEALIAALDRKDAGVYVQAARQLRAGLERENAVRHLHWSNARINAVVARNNRAIKQTGTPLARWDGLSTILETSTSSQLRAAALQALKYVEHVKVIGRRTDARGRTGIAIEHDNSSNTTEVMIVDPGTGNLLQDTVTLSRIYPGEPSPGALGTVLSRVIWLSRAVVDHDGDE